MLLLVGAGTTLSQQNLIKQVNLTHVGPTDFTGIGNETLRIYFIDGYELFVSSYLDHQPRLQLAKTDVFAIDLEELGLLFGPWLEWRDNKLTAYGIFGDASIPVGTGKLQGSINAFANRATGDLTFSASNTRLFWNVKPELDLGIGLVSVFQEKKEPAYLIGPWTQWRLNKKISFRARFGRWLSGSSQGQDQIRLDLTSKF